MKLIDLSLEALYSKPKITKAVEDAIIAKDNFTSINSNYCEKVCQLKCKNYKRVILHSAEVDVLIIQEHMAIADKYKTGQEVESIYQGIIKKLADDNLRGLTYRIISLLKCQIRDEDIVKNKPPLSTKLAKCHPYMDAEILAMKPKVIISLSTLVTKTLGMSKLSNTGNRGQIHGNVVITVHPKVTTMIRQNARGTMWGPDFYEIIDRDFNKAGRIARGELVVPTLEESVIKASRDIHVCRSLDEVIDEVEAIFNLDEETIISWDTETTGLDPWSEQAKLITMQFGYRDPDTGIIKAVVFPLWHRANNFYNPDEAWEHISAVLTSTLIKKIGHNVKFDILYTYATTGVRVVNVVFDTMLVLHAINSGVAGTYGLKAALWDFLPETGLGGYENLLPSLSTLKPVLEASTEEEEEANESNTTNV